MVNGMNSRRWLLGVVWAIAVSACAAGADRPTTGPGALHDTTGILDDTRRCVYYDHDPANPLDHGGHSDDSRSAGLR